MRQVTESGRAGNMVAVGVALVGAVVILLGALGWLRTGGIARPTQTLDVYFWDVGGRLGVGNGVRLAGVRVGTVADISPVARPAAMEADPAHPSQDTVVLVRCRLDRSVTIKDSYRVRIDASNVVGDSFVEISPVSEEGTVLAAGSALIGESPLDPFGILPAAEKSLTQVGITAEELNKALVEKDLGNEFALAAKATQEAMTEIARVARELTALTQANAGEITTTVKRVSQLTADLSTVAQRMSTLLSDKGLAGEVTQAVRQVSTAAESIGKAGKGLEELLGDEDNVAKLKATIDSAQRTTESLESVAGKLDTVLVKEGGIDKASATLDAAERAANRLEELATNLNKLTKGPLGEQAVLNTIALVQQASKDLSAAANRVVEMLDEEHLGGKADRILSNLEHATAGSGEGAEDVRATAQSARKIGEDLEAAAGSLRKLMEGSSFTEDIARTMAAMRKATENLAEVTERMKAESAGVGGGP